VCDSSPWVVACSWSSATQTPQHTISDRRLRLPLPPRTQATSQRIRATTAMRTAAQVIGQPLRLLFAPVRARGVLVPLVRDDQGVVGKRTGRVPRKCGDMNPALTE
jgi:hypothetical protein